MSNQSGLTGETASGYVVKIEIYEGPMDLLLKLIEKQELDITRVSLAAITDQYLIHLRLIEEVRPEAIVDFLVVAARLLLIKSRMLLPRPPTLEGEEEEDPGEQLARQLRMYKRFKEIAGLLRQKRESGLRAYPRLVPPPQIQRRISLEGLSLADLLEAMKQALEAHPPEIAVNHVVAPLTIRVEDKIEYIMHLTRQRRRFSFQHFLGSASSRMEIIVSFLAILELIKRRQIHVRQDQLFGEILISAWSPQSIPSVES